MRVKDTIVSFLKSSINGFDSEAQVYLFGSRVNDQLRGGDIDVLILSNTKLPPAFVSQLRTNFFKNFGFQKLDVVNYLFTDNTTFKSIILENAIRL
ncbi:MAG: nucleotidyltransferase domain-containing protein [Bacteroidetes bacterium]|nr:nucleotidyltransferase domain-containing protein [Bacteroidota bacterium]